MDPNTRILIIGAGAFGTSTALALAQRSYRNITVLDPHALPSVDAAATDISKIIRSDYNEALYARLGLESIAAWRADPLFRDLYRVPGWVLSAKEKSVPFVEGSVRTAQAMGVQVERLGKEEVRRRWPLVTGDMEGWNANVWNPMAGWAEAGEALRRVGVEAGRRGCRFVSGEGGRVVELVYGADGKCKGAKAADGTVYEANVVVLAAGAWTPGLLDCEGQLTAKGHSVIHIQMGEEEGKRYETLPIMDNLELGYFFPPNKDRKFKMAHGQFVVNTVANPKTGVTTSLPHTFVEHPEDDLPTKIQRDMRANLRKVLPELADRPFCFTRMCWDVDTADRHFLIAPHPGHKGLFLATGGSAHGFKFLPVLGKYIADLLEGKLEDGIVNSWRWRPHQVVDQKDLAHLDEDLELRDLVGWKGSRKTRLDTRQAKL